MGWWIDEGVWGEQARRWILSSWRPGDDIGSLAGYYTGFLYSTLLLPVFLVLGIETLPQRWVSLSFGVLSVPLLYGFLRKAGWEKQEGIQVCLLFAFATGQLLFSRIARPDTMGQSLALGALLLAATPKREVWGGMLLGAAIFFVKANYWIYGIGVLVFLWKEWSRLIWFGGGLLLVGATWGVWFGLDLWTREQGFLEYMAVFNQPDSLGANLHGSVWSPLWRYDPLLLTSWGIFLLLGSQTACVYRRIWWWSSLTLIASLMGLRYVVPTRSLELYPLCAVAGVWLFQCYGRRRLPFWMIVLFWCGGGMWLMPLIQYLYLTPTIPLGVFAAGMGVLGVILSVLFCLDKKYLFMVGYGVPLLMGWLSAFAPYSHTPAEAFAEWKNKYWDGQTPLFVGLPAYTAVFPDTGLQGAWYDHNAKLYEGKPYYYLSLVDRLSLDDAHFSLQAQGIFPGQDEARRSFKVYEDFRGVARFVVGIDKVE
jgi:hypothetical protein